MKTHATKVVVDYVTCHGGWKRQYG